MCIWAGRVIAVLVVFLLNADTIDQNVLESEKRGEITFQQSFTEIT